MGSVIKLTKKDRRAATKRVIAFRKEFSLKPEHSINLDQWYVKDGAEYPHCGSVGCVGGYAVYSPLMKAYCDDLGVKFDFEQEAQLYSFFGVTYGQAERKNLFSYARLSGSMTNKAEGLQRLDKLIKWHKTALAK